MIMAGKSEYSQKRAKAHIDLKKGDLVRFSKVGLNYLYPVYNSKRERAKKRRFIFQNYTGYYGGGPGVCRVKRMTSDSYIYFAVRFLEPANLTSP